MTRIELLEQLSAHGILAYDLRLFLDINPTHQGALTDFRRITEEYRRLISVYEQQFGPLTGGSDVTGAWATTPWPWQLEGSGGKA